MILSYYVPLNCVEIDVNEGEASKWDYLLKVIGDETYITVYGSYVQEDPNIYIGAMSVKEVADQSREHDLGGFVVDPSYDGYKCLIDTGLRMYL